MSDSDLGAPAATPVWARSPLPVTLGNAGSARTEKRVVLGDLTNIAGGRFGVADAEKEIHEARKLKPLDEARKLKPSFPDIELLKGRLLEEQQRWERAETELSKLKGIQARALLASCNSLLGDKPDGFSYANMPQQLADSKKQALSNLNKAGEATLLNERGESATEKFAAVSNEKDRPRKGHFMLPEQEPIGGDATSLKDMSSRMDRTMGELEAIIEALNEIITQHHNNLNIMNERLSTEERKGASLERERDQLCSEVAVLQSKLGYEDFSASVPLVVNTPVGDSEAKPELKKTAEWLHTVEELKRQAGYVKKQLVLIEISDDEETSMWYDDDDKKPSKPSSSGESGGECFQQRASCEWFFRGNKLMLSSGMKKQLKEICGYVLPEIPFYLYQMNKSNLKPKGRMRLSAKYTSAHLLSFLHKREGCARLELDGEDFGTVRIILGRDGRASLSSDWQGGECFKQRASCERFFLGNKLMLSSGMKKQLKEICGYVLPEIPFYLYQMNKSNLKPKGRMRLSAKYTSAHLLSFLHKREGCARLELDGEDFGTVRIILGRDGRASLSSD